jgi:hypothetical protein
MILGVGLLSGAAAGQWLSGDAAAAQPAADRTARAYARARELWHSVPVDSLFPRTVTRANAGPGGADRTWIRVGVAPDGGCQDAFDQPLARELAAAGCVRLMRATYTDVTSSDVTTVGLLVTKVDEAAMTTLSRHFASQRLGYRHEMMPRPVAFPGTDSAGFGLAQRASWIVNIPAGLPAVVYAVSGFADGRAVADPQPAAAAIVSGATSVPAQAGLGFEAQGIAGAIQDRVAAAADPGAAP